MIIEKIFVRNKEEYYKWFNSEQIKDTLDILTKNLWTKENTLRYYNYGDDIKAVVMRGKDSLAKEDISIGTLTDTDFEDDGIIYFDDIFLGEKFGKTCVFNNDAPIFQLFMKGKIKDIHPINTESNLISKVAMGRVLERMKIEFEFLPDADIILLPSRNKFSCGFSRFMYLDTTKRKPEDLGVRYEAGWITYYMNHELFQIILPPEEYNRELSKDPDHAGINGIENEHPDFDRELFLTEWYQEICNILGDSISESKETILEISEINKNLK